MSRIRRRRSRSPRRPPPIFRVYFRERDEWGALWQWPYAYFLTRRDALEWLASISRRLRATVPAGEIEAGWHRGRWLYTITELED
jgi:hypothetical protein